MEQTKTESALEASLNTFTGFFISLAVWIFVVAPLFGITVRPMDNFAITCIFTVTSILRSYAWRRFFNAGRHKMIHEMANEISAGRGARVLLTLGGIFVTIVGGILILGSL